MAKAFEDFKFGLFMGMGLIVAYGLLKLILFILEILLSGMGHQGAPKL